MKFVLKAPFQPTGDQPQAIQKLTHNLQKNKQYQVLLGVTGSGKTFTMANIIANIQKPTLVISHNKTLAAQLYQEFREFFPKNAVCYFVSYYDYYQPEAYIPQTDTYIAKETEINEEIDKLRLSATTNLLTRPDTLVVASVSCIYNLGSPIEYGRFILELRTGVRLTRQSILERLLGLQYDRSDYGFHRSTFRVHGDTIEVFPSYEDSSIRIEMSDERIRKMMKIDPLTGRVLQEIDAIVIYPAKHYMTDPRSYENVFSEIHHDLSIRVKELQKEGKDLEGQRLMQRTNYDIEMIQEVGYVNGIENYSRYFDGRKPGEPPYTLLDYFEASTSKQGSLRSKGSSLEASTSKQGDWLLIIDESHITVPQLRGMYNGDRSRKETLVTFGFRLPSALDNRPLKFSEFMARVKQTIFVSATPDEWELSLASEDGVAQQLIRPTGLVDPKVIVRKTPGQINDLIAEIEKRVSKNERILVTTLTKRMAEDLTRFLKERGIKVNYLHSDIETLERQDILDDLRRGAYDVVVGINLLREGLDLPEVSLVAILDADKEGFLRSKTSLIQTMGRAARHIDSTVIMYADVVTKSMREATAEVARRKKIQENYNRKHKITPASIQKAIRAKLVEEEHKAAEKKTMNLDLLLKMGRKEVLLPDDREFLIRGLTKEMRDAAKLLDFETAALIRDQIRLLKRPLS